MRICMLNITSGGMSGGYRTYLANLVPRLAAHPGVSELLVGMPQAVDQEVYKSKDTAVQWLPLRCRILCAHGGITNQERRVIEDFAPDVLFIPTARYWSLGLVPVVNMVRNMMPMMPHYSEYCIERARNWARFCQMRRAVKASDRVIAISEFVKASLTTQLIVPEDKIGVVYHGADSNGSQAMHKPEVIPGDWAGRFVFTAGLIYPYRGLEDQIEAWHHLCELPNLPHLVIAGKVGQGMSRYYHRLQQLVRHKKLDSHVHFVGLLAAGEMAWCYRHCACFLMSSRVEACPNIALEAMTHGCVCIAADSPPLPEFFREAAMYYQVERPQTLSQGISAVCDWSPDQRKEMSQRATARAARFRWDTCCDETMRELRMAIERRR